VKRLAGFCCAALLAGCAAQPERPAAPPQAAAPEPPKSMQWLYGSGEAAALSVQSFHALRDYAVAAARRRPRDSAVLATGAALDRPTWVPCGNWPLAVVLDADETVILNLGYEYHEARTGRPFSPEVWSRWEQTGADRVAPVPGAVTALRAIRAAGVAVVFNTNRRAENAAATEAALAGAGLGPARHRETLFLAGDDDTGSAKDRRRATISQRYCVIAMAGDQLGDFSDLFNAKALSIADRRRLATNGALAVKWGEGWFLLPNPVYGSGVRGGFDDIFPADKRWSDPAGEN
jgi:5'-nucleotidase (lipoprotein e(P4) family)